jgi:hypothetical protein
VSACLDDETIAAFAGAPVADLETMTFESTDRATAAIVIAKAWWDTNRRADVLPLMQRAIALLEENTKLGDADSRGHMKHARAWLESRHL